MIGNRTGWIIASIVLALEGAGVWYALSLDAPSAPTALTSPSSLAVIRLPTLPAALKPQVGQADAKAIYHSAIEEYSKRVEEIETMIRDADRAGLARLKTVDKIIAAASAAGDAIFKDELDQIIAYGEPARLTALSRVGYATYWNGALQGRREADRVRAESCYRAAFVLGWRLANERFTWLEYDAGVGLMSEAGEALATIWEKDPARSADAATLRTFLTTLRTQYKQHLEIIGALRTNNETAIARHAGDVFAFATESPDTMWRVEAILAMGRFRYNVGVPPVPGNQRQANRLLRQLKGSSDPITRRAAEVASELTVEEFRTLR